MIKETENVVDTSAGLRMFDSAWRLKNIVRRDFFGGTLYL